MTPETLKKTIIIVSLFPAHAGLNVEKTNLPDCKIYVFK